MKPLGYLVIGLALLMGGPARASLVTNGNFATGDFTGWTNPGGSGIVIDTTFPAPGDTYDAAFTGTGTLSQTIATTPATGYTISVSLLDESGFVGDTFTVDFGGFSATVTGDLASSYLADSFTVPASDVTSTSTILSFQGANLSSDWNLDDVSVTQSGVPVPPLGLPLLAAAAGLIAFARGRRAPR